MKQGMLEGLEVLNEGQQRKIAQAWKTVEARVTAYARRFPPEVREELISEGALQLIREIQLRPDRPIKQAIRNAVIGSRQWFLEDARQQGISEREYRRGRRPELVMVPLSELE